MWKKISKNQQEILYELINETAIKKKFAHHDIGMFFIIIAMVLLVLFYLPIEMWIVLLIVGAVMGPMFYLIFRTNKKHQNNRYFDFMQGNLYVCETKVVDKDAIVHRHHSYDNKYFLVLVFSDGIREIREKIEVGYDLYQKWQCGETIYIVADMTDGKNNAMFVDFEGHRCTALSVYRVIFNLLGRV